MKNINPLVKLGLWFSPLIILILLILLVFLVLIAPFLTVGFIFYSFFNYLNDRNRRRITLKFDLNQLENVQLKE